MNSKKSNWLFLSVVILHLVLVIGLVACSQFFSLGIFENLLVSQMIILVPALLFLCLGKRENNTLQELGFRKIRISTYFLIILYNILCMPLITVVNAISMLFVDNTVVTMSSDILNLPFPVMLLMIAVIGPLSEEFVFRGVAFSGYKKDGSLMGAVILSALIFGLMHMNFNQAGYAFVIGIALALLMVATRSIIAPMFMHFLINAQSVCTMYLTDYIQPGSFEAEAELLTKDALLMTIGIYSIIAAVTTVLAVCLLNFVARREGGQEDLKNLWKKPEVRKRRITLPLIIACIISLLYMTLEAILMNFM